MNLFFPWGVFTKRMTGWLPGYRFAELPFLVGVFVFVFVQRFILLCYPASVRRLTHTVPRQGKKEQDGTKYIDI